jgi:O-antigen ligase
VQDRPMGVGLFNYESVYDRYDFLGGKFGERRSVHSSHFQVLAETGLLGAFAWTGLFGYSIIIIFRIRRRGFLATVPEDKKTYITSANALMASMMAFLVGGAFIAMALNDLTWVTFALLAALDRISSGACEPAPALAAEPPALAGAAVSVSYRTSIAGRQ